MSADDYADLREKAEAATPGPWRAVERGDDVAVHQVRDDLTGRFNGIANCDGWNELSDESQDTHNAAYIAAASPDRIIALLDENETLRRERDEWRRAAAEQTRLERDRAEAAEAERDALRAQVEAVRALADSALMLPRAMVRDALDTTPAPIEPDAEERRVLMTEPHDGHPSNEVCPGCPHEPDADERKALGEALRGHRLDTANQDSGHHCICGSDSRAEQHGGDGPWRDLDEHRADAVLAAGYRRTASRDADVARREGAIYAEVRVERDRAHAKHGAASMESQPPDAPLRLSILIEEVGEVGREFNEASLAGRPLDLSALRAECIQVAAMAVAWADAIPRAEQVGG